MALDFDRTIIGSEFDRTVFAPVTKEAIVEYASTSGEPAPNDVTAPPTFVVRLRGHRWMPENMPKNLGRAGFDAGKDIEFGAPVRVGDVLTAVSSVHDIYEKTGRTGRMIFLVSRMELYDSEQVLVSIIDSRLVIRERPSP